MAMHSLIRSGRGLLIFLTLAGAICLVGSEGVILGGSGWYQTSDRPVWAAPLWLFVPLTTLLYLLSGLGAWLTARSQAERSTESGILLLAFAVVGAIYPWVFFVLNKLPAACVVAFGAVLILLGTLVLSVRGKSLAGCLLVPALVWYGYLGALTIDLAKRNPPNSQNQRVINVTPDVPSLQP